MSLAEVDPWTAIFIAIYVLFEYVLPLLRKRNARGAEADETLTEASPSPREVLVPVEEPKPATETTTAPELSASRESYRAAFLASRRALSEALSERRILMKQTRRMTQAGRNAPAVSKLLERFETEAPASVFEERVRADADAAASQPELITETHEMARGVLSQTAMLHTLHASIGRVATPAQTLLWSAADEMTSRLRQQLGQGRRHQQWELLAVSTTPHAGLEGWCRRAGVVPLTIPAEVDPITSFGALSRLMQSIVLSDRAALETTLDETWDVLSEVVQGGTPTGKAVAELLDAPHVPRQLVSAIPFALLAKHTGPMAIAVDNARGVARNPSPLLAALFDRAGFASVHVKGGVKADSQLRVAWDYIAASLQDALSESAFSDGADISLWHLTPSWGPSEDQSVTRTLPWLTQQGQGALTGPLSPCAALVAWAVHLAEGGAGLDHSTVERLTHVVFGDQVEASGFSESGELDRSAMGVREATVLHAILSPPLALTHHAQRRPNVPIWGRRGLR